MLPKVSWIPRRPTSDGVLADVVVVGGGNAALCAALMAREAGASVLLLEASPREWRGGNSQHTRNLRCMHDAPQDVLIDAYPEEEYWQDLLKVTGGLTDEHLARLVIRASSNCRDWMRSHGVHFQPPLSGALHVARTNAFFMGGGKALVNAYFRSAEKLGVQIRYDTPVASVELDGDRFVAVRTEAGERIEAKSCVLASGGFESNREWLREAWGQNERGEWPADNFLIRGTRFNQGVLLKYMIAAGADSIGDPSQGHMVAIDARAPLYDGGICTRIDCVSLGVVVNREASASTTRAKTSGPSAMRSGAGSWRSSRGRSPGRSSTRRRSAVSCRRCSPARRPHAGRTRAEDRPGRSHLRAHRAGLQRRLPRRPLRPHRAGRLPHRRHRARQDALGAPAGHRALLRLPRAPRHHLHVPRPEGGRDRGRALRRTRRAPTCSWPAK
jgi:succinate dehydrogenase/fumarate reductase flavoprotein subunit